MTAALAKMHPPIFGLCYDPKKFRLRKVAEHRTSHRQTSLATKATIDARENN